ncbi:hypothetical protein, partial [Caballeronia grimmiae]|uniref:hypothetical protein n=1 Tax=Caballeronia grimmiae TaxID=1071679 RepID=UPI0038BDFF98
LHTSRHITQPKKPPQKRGGLIPIDCTGALERPPSHPAPFRVGAVSLMAARVAMLAIAIVTISVAPEVEKSNRSPIAGAFTGTYGLLLRWIGFGRLSRLRPVIGGKSQLRSMNFTNEGSHMDPMTDSHRSGFRN